MRRASANDNGGNSATSDGGAGQRDPQITPADLACLGVAANDNATLWRDLGNQPVTITSIRRDAHAKRVYNLEIESRPGEITHNYFVGDELVWVHNAYQRRTPAKRARFKSRKCAYDAALKACGPGEKPIKDWDPISGWHFHPVKCGERLHNHYKFPGKPPYRGK